MNTQKNPQFFYQYLGAHSLLIGLLPFFLPVYLWQHGLGLAGLCVLIGTSGFSFSIALRLWQRLSRRWPLKRLISLTFFLELLLVVTVGLLTTVPGAALFQVSNNANSLDSVSLILAAGAIGLSNGLYNAFFWTTQRTLFLQQLGSNDTGRQYGNFQIFVTLFLKAGILLGGFLLEQGGFVWLLALSAGIGFAASHYLEAKAHPNRLQDCETVSATTSLRFSDRHGSKPVFIIDGIFLYLESHFWTLSLFLLVRQDYTKLGVAVVVLAVVFALLFFLIKNRIDQLAVNRVYRVAVFLYAVSWLLRFTLDSQSTGSSLVVTLIVITFFSSFFRLAFNKRFFDIARTAGTVRYLLVKSYSSQIWLGAGFLTMALVLLTLPINGEQALRFTYLLTAILSLVYLRYRDDT